MLQSPVVHRRPVPTRLLPTRLAPTTLALGGLVAITASWGSTFFMLKGIVTRVPPADFLAVRFLLAAAVVWAVAPHAVRGLSSLDRRRGVILGIVYGAAQLLQTIGLENTSASVSGFLTGSYVVLTPLIAAFAFGAKLSRRVWFAVGLATLGLAVLSLQGVAIGSGEILTLLGAVAYALHVVGLSVWSRSSNVLGMTIIQLFTTAAVCALGAVPGGIVLPTRTGDWAVLVYMALVAGALALLVQSWAQSQVSAARAAIAMTMEPVWAAAFAVAFGGETLGLRALAGGGLVLAAMYLVEVGGSAPAGESTAPAPTPDPVWEERLIRCDEWEDFLSPRTPDLVCAGSAPGWPTAD